MALRYYYADSATTVLDITARCRLYRTSVKSNAEEGSVALSTLIIDDPDGDLIIIPFRRIYIVETSAPVGAQVVYNGYVADREVRRGPYRIGAGREWVVSLSDPNWFIGLRIVVGADGNRPAEDDYTRVTWLLTTTEANTFNGSSQYVSSTVTRFPMDAVDYRGQSVTSILDDCAQQSGKNYWIVYFEALGQYGLWYDFADSPVYDSTLQLANTLADVDNVTTFAISEENTTLERSPSRLVSGVYLPYDGGYVYRLNAATGSTYVYRDAAAPSVNVKTAAKATARADRYLTENDSEDDVIRTEVLLPAASVNKIMHGMRLQVKASHLPGYESYSWMRVLNRTVTETSEERLTIALELSSTAAPAQVEQFFTHTQLQTCNTGQWPEGSPGAGLTLIGFLVQRGGTTDYGAAVVPIGNEGPVGSCGSPDISGTGWTYLGSVDIGVNAYPQTAAIRFPSIAAEPEIIRWGGAGGMGGTTRPRSYQIATAGLAGTGVYSSSEGFGNTGTVFTSHTVTATGPGYIFGTIMRSSPGPSEASAAYTFAARAPAFDLAQGYAQGGFAPNSWCGGLRVDSSGTYSITLDCSAIPRDPGDAWSWQLVFCADA